MKVAVLTMLCAMLNVKANAQVFFSVKVDSFFNFKFKATLSASDALNNNDFITLQGNVGETIIIVDEQDKSITMKFEDTIYVLDMLGHPNGNKSAYVYQYYEGNKLIVGQMSFVDGYTTGNKYVIAESEDPADKTYTKATIAKIK
jgi:hypothetical protein